MQLFILLGALVSLIFSLPYAIATLRGLVQPNRVSWLLWTITPGIGFFASVSHGFTWGEMPVLISTMMSGLVLVCSFTSSASYWELRLFDFICGIFSFMALIAWLVTKDPNIAIIFSICSDFLACVPTLIKAWFHPETEGIGPYSAGIFNMAMGFIVMTRWEFMTLAFPIYLFLMNAFITSVILIRRRHYA